MRKALLFGVVVAVLALFASPASADDIYMREIPDYSIYAGDTIRISHLCYGTIRDATPEFGVVGVLEVFGAEGSGVMEVVYSKVFTKTYGFNGEYTHWFKVILKTEFTCTGPGDKEGHACAESPTRQSCYGDGAASTGRQIGLSPNYGSGEARCIV